MACLQEYGRWFYSISTEADGTLIADGSGLNVPDMDWVVFESDDATVRAMVEGETTITESGEGWRLRLSAEPLLRRAGQPTPPTDVQIQVHPGVAKSALRDPDHADFYWFTEHKVRFRLAGDLLATDGGQETDESAYTPFRSFLATVASSASVNSVDPHLHSDRPIRRSVLSGPSHPK